MNEILILLGEWLASLPTYLLNGLLVTLYWLIDSAAALLSIGCALLIIQFADRRIQERAMFRPTREGREVAVADPHTAQILTGVVLTLWLVSQWSMGAPVPWIGAAMWLFGAIVLLLVRHQQLNTLWSIKSGIAIYALAVIGSRLYLTYTADLSPEQWAALIGSADSAATVLANTRGNVTTIILWALWLVIPLGYFAMLLQQVLLNPVSLVSPAAAAHELIERYRVRQ